MPTSPYDPPKGEEKPPIGFWKKAELLLNFICVVAILAILISMAIFVRRESVKSRIEDEQRAIQKKASTVHPKSNDN